MNAAALVPAAVAARLMSARMTDWCSEADAIRQQAASVVDGCRDTAARGWFALDP